MSAKERVITYIICALIFLLILFLGLVLFVQIAYAQEDMPTPPAGCALAEYSGGGSEWGGWVVAPPYITCGVSAKVDGQWHTLSKPLNNSDCLVSTAPYRQQTCILEVDGTVLKEYSMLAEDGTEIQGISVTGDFDAAVSWIPVQQQGDLIPPVSLQWVYLPVAFREWGVCIPGCVSPPWPTIERTR